MIWREGLFAADHENGASRRLGVILGRSVNRFGAGGQVGKLALQRRKIGRSFGRRGVGVDHRWGSSLQADSRVIGQKERQDWACEGQTSKFCRLTGPTPRLRFLLRVWRHWRAGMALGQEGHGGRQRRS